MEMTVTKWDESIIKRFSAEFSGAMAVRPAPSNPVKPPQPSRVEEEPAFGEEEASGSLFAAGNKTEDEWAEFRENIDWALL